jgi:hypothetical protein
MFCSLNTCRTFTKSRRDDFESLLYILLYLTNDLRLPWSDIKMGKTPNEMSANLEKRL